MDKTEKQIRLYSSILIALMLNSGKLLALRGNAVLSRFMQINPVEVLFQVVFQFGVCYLLFTINLKNNALSRLKQQKRYVGYVLLNLLILWFCMMAGGIFQRRYFDNDQFRGVYWATYMGRFFLTGVLIAILLKIVDLTRKARSQAAENEKLKSVYAVAELELLKEQLNPHFLFNSLSSLSGVVREDPAKAQQYIKHLSKVFRYALIKPQQQLVSVDDEITMVLSFAQLLQMRLENAFELEINIDERYLQYKLPHLSLQPLLENAAKHNAATVGNPLKVSIYMALEQLVVSNNLQPVMAISTGIGLANLNERYKILMQHEVEIERTAHTFTVKLPLKP